MAVEIQVRSEGRSRVVEYPDGPDAHFTAQQFADGRVEVRKHRQERSDEGQVIQTYLGEEVERVINNGWPNDDGPLF